MTLTKQEIFDRVVERLFDGTGPAVDYTNQTEPNCSYLTKDGLKCAVGIFIPDGHVAQNETYSLNRIISRHPDLEQLWGTDNIVFMRELQKVHDHDIVQYDSRSKFWDNNIPTKHMAFSLSEIASLYEVATTVLDAKVKETIV